MVELKTKLKKEPQEGQEYKIVAVAQQKIGEFEGLQVTMKSINETDKSEYTTMLWTRESAGLMSKLGAFLEAFSMFLEKGAEETDNWIGHTIGFLQWQPKRREIEVTQ